MEERRRRKGDVDGEGKDKEKDERKDEEKDKGKDWGGDRGDMEIPDVGWCLGSLCRWIGVVIGVIWKFLMWDGV